MNAEIENIQSGKTSQSAPTRVPDHYLFRLMGQKINKVAAKKAVN